MTTPLILTHTSILEYGIQQRSNDRRGDAKLRRHGPQGTTGIHDQRIPRRLASLLWLDQPSAHHLTPGEAPEQ
jgi:hypothetical protein